MICVKVGSGTSEDGAAVLRWDGHSRFIRMSRLLKKGFAKALAEPVAHFNSATQPQHYFTDLYHSYE